MISDISQRNIYSGYIKKFQTDRFGMFIHFGLYSILGRGEWAMYNEAIPFHEYHRLIDRFSLPENFSIREWLYLAKESGARYCVFTARHHEGFCLWDTSTTDFNSSHSACSRDLVKEYVQSARDLGLKIGLYYSLLDWSDDGYIQGPKHDRSRWNAFIEKVHMQVKELMTNYGQIDILWYDGFWPIDNPPYADEISSKDWRSEELNAMVRKLQPQIIINDRSGVPGDFSTPEQEVIAKGKAWEACISTNDNWGYHAGDMNWKTPRQTLGNLVHSVSLGGNLILNIGPRINGSIPTQAVDCFKVMGNWLSKYGKSIYGCTKPFHIAREALDGGYFCNSGIWTLGPDDLYYHSLRWTGSEIRVRIEGIIIDKVIMLHNEEECEFAHEGSSLIIKNLPINSPDLIDTVFAIKYHR